jgi:hypothetical protein
MLPKFALFDDYKSSYLLVKSLMHSMPAVGRRKASPSGHPCLISLAKPLTV